MPNNTSTAPSAHPAAKLTTQELADILRVAPQTVRAGLSRNGHYLGLKPIKLMNGKLRWDNAKAQRLLSEGEK